MAEDTAEAETQELVELLDYLKRSRGFDFSGYKKATLRRRIEKRMQAVGSESFAEYQDHLEVNPREFTALFNTILINVTSFFRDPAAWDYLAEVVVPKLLEAVPAPEPLRIWSAGCASGEEPYTIAMVLAEAMGEAAFKERVKIYATDLDDEALADARQAVYGNDALKGVPDELVDKYFEPSPRGLAFRLDLRRTVTFGRNDLVSDAPISRIDLLTCRNVLMYFTPETQARVLERFNFALKPSGYLFLGKSEMLVTHGELFAPAELKWRVFRGVPRANLRERLGFVASDARVETVEAFPGVRSGAAALSPVAQIVIDRSGALVDANERAREVFALGAGDIGLPFRDVPVSYRPIDLRPALGEVLEKGVAVHVGRAVWRLASGDERSFEIEVSPVPGSDGTMLGATITFVDITALAHLHDDHERSKRELETAYEELQSTVEELETTNEELQSTNEELETTNEELQSTNEELETMNEELQSTNDELETMNTESTSRATELDRVNLFLEGILAGLKVGVAVIDHEHRVQVWNAMSFDLWGIRSDEAQGHDFMELDIGLPVKDLREPISTMLRGKADSEEVRVPAVNRRGRQFECVVRLMSLRTRANDIYGVMILTSPAVDNG